MVCQRLLFRSEDRLGSALRSSRTLDCSLWMMLCLAYAHHLGARWGRGGARETENHCKMVRDVASSVSE
jgi:hypothetical protein